jgi:hypothetical protein
VFLQSQPLPINNIGEASVMTGPYNKSTSIVEREGDSTALQKQLTSNTKTWYHIDPFHSATVLGKDDSSPNFSIGDAKFTNHQKN